MSDSKLRELERRWRETGSVDDEAAYLRERVRVGDLTQERLELAAYCGHEGARKALGQPLESPGGADDRWGVHELAGHRLQGVLSWLGGVPGPSLVAVALETVRDVLHIWDRRESGSEPHDLVRLAATMLVAPTPHGLNELATRCADAQERAEHDIPAPARSVLLGASEIGLSITRHMDPAPARQAIFHALLAMGEDALMPEFPLETDPADAPEAPGLEECLRAIESTAPALLGRLRSKLMLWALDASDSVLPHVPRD